MRWREIFDIHCRSTKLRVDSSLALDWLLPPVEKLLCCEKRGKLPALGVQIRRLLLLKTIGV